ncbi:hypothetical protein CEUSTIGMA_g6771.t1 [Chlamydomonas eustigma]|uniref:Uncharacterized protein n=1 Tax=Chlamydomonas eustigma TaxID=1157962 RepID=A0A250X982_9CHLO|nr:hypothetical protein CEUSTIGMA_g6771.t1 [Chlamydomonas eustigma]|eukprot:GAX79330.1 hypothetical protein CEUSTIGMA_g6771.t1 [Chlamydomonas eustigma]
MIATALSGLERLQSIDLSKNCISASSVGVLMPSLGCLTTLKSLNLSSNRDLLSEDGASHISAALINLTGLTFLGMSEVSGLSAGVQQLRVLTLSLAALTKLERLDLWRSVFLAEEIASSVLAPALRQLSALTQLVVGDYKMNIMGSVVFLSDDESSVVLAVLRSCSFITDLQPSSSSSLSGLISKGFGRIMMGAAGVSRQVARAVSADMISSSGGARDGGFRSESLVEEGVHEYPLILVGSTALISPEDVCRKLLVC